MRSFVSELGLLWLLLINRLVRRTRYHHTADEAETASPGGAEAIDKQSVLL
jgi:hypothetical protein